MIKPECVITERPLIQWLTFGTISLITANVLVMGGFALDVADTGSFLLGSAVAIVVSGGLLLVSQLKRRTLAAPSARDNPPLLKAGALQDAVFNSAIFSSIAT